MRAGKLQQLATVLMLRVDTLAAVQMDKVWVGIKTRDGVDTPPARGLRNPAVIQVLAWHSDKLQQGRYLQVDNRLLVIDAARDPDGRREALSMSCTELIGEPCTFTPKNGAGKSARVYVQQTSPSVGQRTGRADYRVMAEFALIEVGRIQPGDTVTLYGATWTVSALSDEPDDGVTRKVWLTP
jgi:hypothetical protein